MQCRIVIAKCTGNRAKCTIRLPLQNARAAVKEVTGWPVSPSCRQAHGTATVLAWVPRAKPAPNNGCQEWVPL